MSGVFRKLNPEFWDHADVIEFNSETKLLYLYLISKARAIGIVEFSFIHAQMHLNLNEETIATCLNSLERSGKIKRSKSSKELAVLNFWKYNGSTSPNTRIHIIKSVLPYIKDMELAQFVKDLDPFVENLIRVWKLMSPDDIEQLKKRLSCKRDGDSSNDLIEFMRGFDTPSKPLQDPSNQAEVEIEREIEGEIDSEQNGSRSEKERIVGDSKEDERKGRTNRKNSPLGEINYFTHAIMDELPEYHTNRSFTDQWSVYIKRLNDEGQPIKNKEEAKIILRKLRGFSDPVSELFRMNQEGDRLPKK